MKAYLSIGYTPKVIAFPKSDDGRLYGAVITIAEGGKSVVIPA